MNYETGYHFEITFDSETQLTWHVPSKRAEGVPETESEPYEAYDLGDDKFMINWIWETGLIVSQIQDYANGKVYAYMTWPDKNVRGQHAQLLHKRTLTVLE
ncbi:hypothetical protein HMPREF2909_05585 [Alloscardovia sp. HMSC034E08]|nr:hypothetical protein HMPREF2909_05585 [Alloscardovia sp. HMSC034E08]